MSKTVLLLSSGALSVDFSPGSRYYFLPNSSGSYVTESQGSNPLGIVSYPTYGRLLIHHDGHPITFPKIRTASGGLKITGTGFETGGTRFFNESGTNAINVKSIVGGAAFLENSPASKLVGIPGVSGYYLTDSYSGGGEGYTGSGTFVVTFDVTGWTFPKIRTGSGGIKVSGDNSGTRFYTDSIVKSTPYIFTYLNSSEIYGQSDLKSPYYLIPNTGSFLGEDIEGPSGLLLSGTGSYYKVQKITYTVIPSVILPGGTTDRNQASNRPVQLPVISGELLIPHDELEYNLENSVECIWIRKYAYTGSGFIYTSGPNNAYEASYAIFDNTKYLSRIVSGVESYTGSNGALFWAWNDIVKKVKGTNYFICNVPSQKFGYNPTLFTWSARFKLDSRIQYLHSSKEVVLMAIVSMDEPDFPPYLGSESLTYLTVSAGSSNSRTIRYVTSGHSGYVNVQTSSTTINLNSEYRIVLHYDSNQSTIGNRVKIYLNGTLLGVTSTEYFPEIDEAGYSKVINPNNTYSYHSIGGLYLIKYQYGGLIQFLGEMYETIFLDDLLKSDSELYSSEYTGPYKTIYSYHLKYKDIYDLGKDYTGNGHNFKDNLSIEQKYTVDDPRYPEDLAPYDKEISEYDNIELEPIFSSKIRNFSSFTNDKIFSFYSEVYIPSCIRNYLNFNQFDSEQQVVKGTQALRSVSNVYDITDKTRLSIGIRFFVSPEIEYSTNFEGGDLVLLSLNQVTLEDLPYTGYLIDGYFNIFLSNSEYDNNQNPEKLEQYKGFLLKIQGLNNCSITIPAKYIQANKFYRLVINIDSNQNIVENRLKIYLNDSLVPEEDILVDQVYTIEEPIDSGIFYRVVDYGYPYINEAIYDRGYERGYGTYLGSYISVGSVPFEGLWWGYDNYRSFFGKLGEIILVDGRIIDSDVLLPISGYYEGEYGDGKGTFHYKFNSSIGVDSGPNNYTLEDIGPDDIASLTVNENSGKALFVIQNSDGYYKDISQYYRFGFGSNNTQNILAYQAVGTQNKYAYSSTVLTANTWHTVQFSVDTSQINAIDRVKIYLDKNLLTYHPSSTHISQNTSLYNGSGVLYQPYMVIGNNVNYDNSVESIGFTGYLQNTIYLDGYTVDSGFFDPLVKPFSYGGSGFELIYSDVTNLGYDSSPYKNHFTNFNVLTNYDYENSYEFGKALGFIIYRDTTPIQDINLVFKLISAEEVELVLQFVINLDPLTLNLPLKLVGSGQEVEITLPFKLLWTANFDSGYHSQTDTKTAVLETPINLTFENLSNTLVTDVTNTIHYEFGTSESDPNSKNGWIDIITGKLYIFSEDVQYSKDVSNLISSNSTINVNYQYNLSQSLLIWKMTCSAGELIGDISIEYEEDASTIAKFTLLPPSGNVDPLDYIGSIVTLDVTFSDSSGAPYADSGGRVFTGLISEVEWDADLRVINVTADTQMPAYFNALSREEIEGVIGGMWSDQVWDNEDDATGWTYAQERLSTTENTIWHDKNWVLRINSFRATTPTVTFTDDERFHETLKLEFAQRSEMVNEIRIDMDYKYPRRRQRKLQFKWTDASHGSITTYLCGGNSYQLCQRSMVEGAATGSSWVPITKIYYTDIWPPQGVWCGPGSYDGIIWGYQVNDVYTPKKDKDGNYSKVTMVNVDTGSTKDSGNTVYTQVTSGQPTMYYEGYEADPTSSQVSTSMTPPSVTMGLCIGAKWTAARRWIQDVSEYYEIIMKCQDSIDTIGVVASTESYSIDSGIQDDEWENSITPYKEGEPTGWGTIPGTDDKYWNADEDPNNEEEDIVTREDFELAQEVVMATAKVDILKAHRLTTVSFKVPFQSGLDLSNTISVSTPYLSATGKVKILKHQFSIDSGEASTEVFLAISRHNGSGLYEDDPLEPLDRPEPTTENHLSSYVNLDNYVGGRTYGNIGFTGKWYDGRADGEEDPENEGEYLPGKEPWEGFMTNYESPLTSTEWNAYWSIPSNLFNEAAWKARLDVSDYIIPYQFIVKGPDIDETHTTASNLQAAQTFNVVVPVDPLELYA